MEFCGLKDPASRSVLPSFLPYVPPPLSECISAVLTLGFAQSEELLSQLAVRQHESILEYRTQVSALRRQTSLLEKRVVETERREAVVAEAWASLNAALLLLRDQLSSPQSPVSELSRVVSSWICKPGKLLTDPRSNFVSKTDRQTDTRLGK